MKRSPRRRGVAAVLALIVLAMFTILGVDHIWSANSSLLKAANLNRVHQARQQAESGLEYFTYVLTRAEVPAGLTGEALLAALADALSAPLNTEISADDSNGGFTAALSAEGSVVTLTVRGRPGSIPMGFGSAGSLGRARPLSAPSDASTSMANPLLSVTSRLPLCAMAASGSSDHGTGRCPPRGWPPRRYGGASRDAGRGHPKRFSWGPSGSTDVGSHSTPRMSRPSHCDTVVPSSMAHGPRP